MIAAASASSASTDSFEQVAKRAIDAVFNRLSLAADHSATALRSSSKDELWGEAVRTVLAALAPGQSSLRLAATGPADWAACVQKEMFLLTTQHNNNLSLPQAKHVLKERMRRLIITGEEDGEESAAAFAAVKQLHARVLPAELLQDLAARKRLKLARKRTRDEWESW